LSRRTSVRQWYVEPFCGSGAVIEHVPGNRIANDINPYIVAVLEGVQRGWLPPDVVSEDFYNQVRYNKERYCDAIVGFVGFGSSFGGIFWNSYGRSSKVLSLAKEAKQALLHQKPKLKGTIFTSMDYRNLPLPANAIIYCDPPYENTTGYGGAERFDSAAFWQWAREKTMHGFDVYVSEFTAPPDFVSVWSKHRKSTLARKATTKAYAEHIFKYNHKDNAKCCHALF
jgi:Site-specific DNA methylase